MREKLLSERAGSERADYCSQSAIETAMPS